jgi:hypothetical protein
MTPRTRRKIHRHADRIAPNRLLASLRAKKSIAMPTMRDPGRRRAVATLREREAAAELDGDR